MFIRKVGGAQGKKGPRRAKRGGNCGGDLQGVLGVEGRFGNKRDNNTKGAKTLTENKAILAAQRIDHKRFDQQGKEETPRRR